MPPQNDGKSETISTTIVQASSMAEFNIHENWILWHQRLEMHFTEIGCTAEPSKISTLLKTIGSEAYSIVHSLCSPEVPSTKSYQQLCDILKQQFTPPVIVYQERKNFYTAQMAPNETVASWFARVKKLAIDCKFGAQLEAAVKDKFIMELPPKIFEKLCEEDESLQLNDAFKKALLRETKINRANVSNESEVNYVKSHSHRSNNARSNNNSSNNGSNSGSRGKSYGNGNPKKACGHCGWKNHASSSCKYKSSTCHSCGQIGHLQNICQRKDKNTNSVQYVSNNIHAQNDSNDSNDFFNSICSIQGIQTDGTVDFDLTLCNIDEGERALYRLSVEVNGVTIVTDCDTGAPCSLMAASTFDRLFNRKILRPCHRPFRGYTGDLLNLTGEFTASVRIGDQIRKSTIVVTNYDRPTLLGRNFLRAFGFELVQVNKPHHTVNSISNYNEIIEQIKSDFSEVFKSGLGTYNVSKVKLPLVKDATPIYFKARPIPLAFRDGIEKQINNLVEMGVYIPTEDSEHGTPIVPVLKPNGEFRICGDYKSTINKFLLDFKYPLPRIDQIFASMQGGKLFTKLDLSNAYNQLVLDEESQKLCTLSTHKGLYRMARLPYGIKTAAAIFQKTMDNLLSEFTNVFCYQDDIVVTGPNFSDHLGTLKQVLRKIQDVGLRLNVNKCDFFKSKISYLGFDIDEHGLSRNQDRIKSVINSPRPSNASELRAFSGMVNHHSKFTPNFSSKMTPLYNLLQKDVKFEWSNECECAFKLLKKEICSDRVLAHFDPSQKIILATDACNAAVAGVLFHRYENGSEKPIAFVSRSLNSSERNYSTFEKEALAIIFSVTKLKEYLLGYKFTLQTDHKPLITIFGENKGIPIMAAARIQRWAFILSGFNYTIEYIKGTSNSADNLSRIAQFETTDSVDNSNYINYVNFTNVTSIDYKEIAKQTRRDPILSKVMDSINNGTIDSLKGEQFAPFRTKSTELSVESDCVLWGYRTVIPSKLQKDVLQALHTSHMGIVKTKSLARSYVYWPKIDHDIEIMIKSCEACQMTQASPEKSSLIPWTPTDSAWKRVHIDFAGPINGFHLFIIIDSYSKYPEVYKTKTITSKFVIDKLREVFCRFGLIDVLVSDNGRQFTANEFKQFLSKNGIEQILTAPGHPATNGQAENFVKTFKNSLLKAIYDYKNINMDLVINKFLFDYRVTKHCTTSQTPSKLMFGREVKSLFSLMKPPIVSDIIKEKQLAQIKNYKGKRNSEFSIGQKVYVRNYKNPNKAGWSPATIKKKLGPRNYTCLLAHENRNIKRHLDQIRDANVEENIDLSGNDTIVNDGEGEPSAEEQESQESLSFQSANASTDSTINDDVNSPSTSVQNESIADVVERPSIRTCAAEAKKKITSMFTGGPKK